MISGISHFSFFVTDQQKAYEFYVNKLGFKVHTDVTMDNGMRWLTLTAPNAPNQEIVLMGAPEIGAMGWDHEGADALNVLLNKQVLGSCVLHTDDCRKTYEELKAKGVDITEPKEQFYGTECIVKDGCGNWFSLCTPKEGF